MNITGNVTASLHDYVGNTYDTYTASDGGMSFSLNEDVPAANLIGITENEDVEVVYQLNEGSGAPTSKGEIREVSIGLVLVFLSSLITLYFLKV